MARGNLLPVDRKITKGVTNALSVQYGKGQPKMLLESNAHVLAFGGWRAGSRQHGAEKRKMKHGPGARRQRRHGQGHPAHTRGGLPQ
eukprot:6214259-Pleurochrysis_carterae.AAC.1